jgi:hypothetical protein
MPRRPSTVYKSWVAPETWRRCSDSRSGISLRSVRGHVRFIALSSGKQIVAAEIIDRQHDALKVVPPNDRRDFVQRLPHGLYDRP